MDSSSNTIETLLSQGRASFRQKQYQLAVDQFQQALESCSQDTAEFAEISNDLAVTLIFLQQASRSLPHLEKALGIYSSSDDPYHCAITLGNRATAYEAMGKHKEALKDYRHAVDLLKNTPHQDEYMLLRKAQSNLQLKKGRFLEAIVSMDAALHKQDPQNIRDRILKWLLNHAVKLGKQ